MIVVRGKDVVEISVRSSLLSTSYFAIMTMSFDKVSGCTDWQESSAQGLFLSADCD